MDQPIKTWILTKSTGYPTDFRLQLGQVLRDPRQPMLLLFASSADPPPQMSGMQVSEKKTEGVIMGINSSLARCFGLWANTSVLPAAGAIQAARKCQPQGAPNANAGFLAQAMRLQQNHASFTKAQRSRFLYHEGACFRVGNCVFWV
ncbi:hypothetical protein QC762_0088060 [Podospora pseudocomata]|uniref:Uncharacterized protein n=1 Tax=Podospora pseudocomata TaxID=2093779 RepID=A0ABR0GDZ5_9PEZI|nr:hypothetical protein QC762_0088060 [Podospora pseudocomata]